MKPLTKYKWKRDGPTADQSIFLCTSCNKCWEDLRSQYYQSVKFAWYTNFPSYGKKKVICPNCAN